MAYPTLVHRLGAATLFLALSACASRPDAIPAAAWSIGDEATLEGTVVSVDTAPWAYDGNAVVTVAGPPPGNVAVQLPARWNLCKAPPPDEVQALKPGDRVQVAGTVTAPRELVVCQQPVHHLRKLP